MLYCTVLQRFRDERVVNKGKAYVQTIEGIVPWKHEKLQMGATGARLQFGSCH